MPTVTKQKPTKRSPKRQQGTGIAAAIKPMDEGLERGLKINLYGASGTGKTTLWATFPGRILVALCSGGRMPGELLSVNTPEYRNKIDKVEVTSSSQVTEVAKYCNSNPDAYQTLVLDNATGLQDLVLKEILGLEEIPVQKEWGLATQQDYGQVAIQMKERLREMLNFQGNVVIIAQERAFNVEEDVAQLMPYVASALMPSIVGWLNPAVDYLCQTFKRKKVVNKQVKVKNKTINKQVTTNEIEYCLRTGPDDVYMTKFRKPKTSSPLPPVIIDPTYDKLIKLIKG